MLCHFSERRHDIQHNDTQHNNIQHNDTQHNNIHHNDTQRNNKNVSLSLNDIQLSQHDIVVMASVIILSVMFFIVTLSVADAECIVCLLLC